MKYTISFVLAVVVACMSFSVAQASEVQNEYRVEYGDTLWDISQEHLGSPWCWPLIASIPENDLDYQGYLYANSTITLPEPSQCDAIMNPIETEAHAEKEFVGYVAQSSYHSKNHSVGKYFEDAFHTQKTFIYYTSYDNMSDILDTSLYRKRDGDKWYVVQDGERGGEWDYVDTVRRNPDTGSVIYRARDIQGQWYIVKNEEATLLSFEPTKIHLIRSEDSVVAIGEIEFGGTKVFFQEEELRIPAYGVYLVDVSGRDLLFKSSSEYSAVRTLDDEGNIAEYSSSSVKNLRKTYWLNATKIAETSSIMVPQFSDSPAAVELPFWYEGAQKEFKFYGSFGRPEFNSNGDIEFHTLQHTAVYKTTIEVESR